MDDFRQRRVDLYGDGVGGVALIDYMGDDLTPVNAARASLGKVSTEMAEREQKLANFLIKSGHTSTSEHNVLTLWVKVPLFVARQHMRHRTFSFNEISRRYTSENPEFYFPTALRRQDSKNRQASLDETFDPLIGFDPFEYPKYLQLTATNAIKQSTQDALELYNKLIAEGVAREQARMILPQNLYTSYWCTGSLHNWINSFVAKRDHPDAQWEMRLLAQEVSRHIKELWPQAHANYVAHGKIPTVKP